MIEIRGAFVQEEDTITFACIIGVDIEAEFFHRENAEDFIERVEEGSGIKLYIIELCNGIGEIEELCDSVNPAGMDIDRIVE